ncbi:hypothetical protein PV325_011262 [Microctonus aethiopoides]|nr:hypothetical protein PV325_011262 [Microctonus aethiopoides]KAK0073633.1 hypothetical protein PV326_013221 [Microctonus aethiopoides]
MVLISCQPSFCKYFDKNCDVVACLPSIYVILSVWLRMYECEKSDKCTSRGNLGPVDAVTTQEKSGSRTTNQRFAPTNQRWRNPEANSNENPKPYGYIRKNTDSHKKLINENDPRENNADEEEAGDMLDSLPG